MDINKVYKALQWLKDHLHYSEIHLPMSDDFINDKLLGTEYRIVGDGSDSDEIDDVVQNTIQHNKDNNDQVVLKRKAFLMQIIKDSSINDQYIIYPMHAKRTDNEFCIRTLSMLKIEDVPMDNRYKYLNIMCFPDLYPESVNGREDRNFALLDYLFIRTRLMSKHNRFRLKLQYLFFLLNVNYRQLNNGIYYIGSTN